MQKSCVLFDLDGTLADTAPDFYHALTTLQAELKLPLQPAAAVIPYVSEGSVAVLNAAFGLTLEAGSPSPIRSTYLEHYRATDFAHTQLYPGMQAVLSHLEQTGIIWGIITNKPGWLTAPVCERLGLATRAACIISGDTAARAKPHPEPMLLACETLQVAPEACYYVGDAERDMQAGHAVGMTTVFARYGYLPPSANPSTWPIDISIDSPQELLPKLTLQSPPHSERY